MASRSAKFKRGGKVAFTNESDSGKVKREAMARKDGGKCVPMDTHKTQKRASGGRVFSKAGGGTASTSPWSSAHKGG